MPAKVYQSLLLLIVTLLAACAVGGEVVEVTRRRQETAVSFTPTSQPTPLPTATRPSETATTTSPAGSPTTADPAATLSPAATSDVVAGWLLYQNDFYGYQFSYPPEATINTQGVSRFPTEELPEGMTPTEYRRQLEATYPDDICVGVGYQQGFVVFIAPEEEGSKYALCGITGIGAYDTQGVNETVIIDGHPYMAYGTQVRQRNEEATWHSEFYSINLGDGTRISYGSTSGTQEQFLEIKETLLEIVTSFRSEATSRPILTPTPTPIPGLVASAAAITVGDWSLDGRYLTYWTHTPEDLEANPQFPPGDFHFYDAIREQSCSFTGYRSGSTSWKRRHLWLANGSVLIFGDQEILSFLPCSDNFEVVTDRFPEPITRVVTHSPDRTRFLLASETRYWLYRPEGHEVRLVTGFAAGFENGASFSPDGRFVALSGDAGDSYLLDTQTATATRVATWQGPQGLGGLAAPEWLDNEQFIVGASRDRGPLLISVAGSMQNVGEAFFGQAADPGHSALAHRDEQSGNFTVLLHDTSFEGTQPPLQFYYSVTGATQSLPVEGPLDRVDPSFSPGGRWLVLYDHGRGVAGSYNELWVRPLATLAERPRLFESGETIFYRFAPDDTLVAIEVGNFIRIQSPPSAESIQRQGYGPYDIFPYAWSPDSRFLALAGRNRDGEQALFVLPITVGTGESG
ncbi:MAG TPA: hypothetical protein VF177_15070 [Anaerolineae bacterium]